MDLTVLDNLIVGRVEPHIYAFTTGTVPESLKVGDTYRPVSMRLKEWEHVYPDLKKQFEGKAKVSDDIYFRDYSVHQFLERDKGFKRLAGEDFLTDVYHSNEFFKNATVDDVKDAISDINKDFENTTHKYQFYSMETRQPKQHRYPCLGLWEPRPNQRATIEAFESAVANGRTNLLMYAVMRFGKSFTSMCCAKAINANLVVIVSAKADVAEEWKKTVQSAANFSEYEIFLPEDLKRNYGIVSETLKNKKAVVFLTLQDLVGEDIKEKHEQIFAHQPDLLIVDETHFGARAEKYGAVLRETSDVKEQMSREEECTLEDMIEKAKVFNAKVTLHLSGTPYRILMGSEFEKEDIIAFYQFTDIVNEQKAWDRENLMRDDVHEWDNPYYGFPQMVRFAFLPSESARKRLEELRDEGKSCAFSELMKPESVKKTDDGRHKKFVYEQEILELLEVIDGSREDDALLSFLDYDKIKDGKMCRHIVCVLPYCASCDALETLIKNNSSKFKNLSSYEIINISGVEAGKTYKSPKEIKERIRSFEEEGKKTLTLTVNRMLTGSTVEEWDTMLYFKDTSSPQEYDQAIFRLQNQYIKTYKNDNGEVIKYNMKPQTLLVDFEPNRVFYMQEQKAQIYNVNVDEAGNSKLSQRIEEELSISPIIVMNKDKIQKVEAKDILQAVSEYSKNRGVAEETLEIPVDLSLMNFDEIREAIEKENEFGSRAGLSINATEGEGEDLEIDDENESEKEKSDSDKDNSSENSEFKEEKKDNTKDIEKQFRSYYARILFFAFLTKDIVISLDDIVAQIDKVDNIRIAHNLNISKAVLKSINNYSDKFVLRKLDYKIQNLNKLSHDVSAGTAERAFVAVQKFGKLGESEVVTPEKICKKMVDLIPERVLCDAAANGRKILDIAGKAGEFAVSLCEKYKEMGYSISQIKDVIYTVPTSRLTYEFNRYIYEISGLNTDNIAEGFTSGELLKIHTEDGSVDYDKICRVLSQKKVFKEIKTDDSIEISEGVDNVEFDAVVGNPPYQEIVGNQDTNKALGKQLFPNFIILSTKIARYSSLITPSRWFTGKGQDGSFPKLREYVNENNHFVKIVNHLNNDIFPNVSVGSLSYFLYDREYSGDVEFVEVSNGEESMAVRPLFEAGMDKILPMNIMSNYIKKVTGRDDFKSMTEITTSRNPFGVPDSNPRLKKVTKDKRDKKHDTKIMCAYEEIKYTSKDIIKRCQDVAGKWKVFTSKMNGGAGTLFDDKQVAILGRSFVAPPGMICSGALIALGCFDSETEAINLKKYMETKFLRFMAGLLKSSQAIYQNVYQFVPLQDFTNGSDIDWSKTTEEIDKQLYTKYDLSTEEIDYIESVIKPME